MRFHRRFVAFSVVAALVAGVAVGMYLTRAIRRADSVDVRAVAYVNGAPINADDLDVRLEQILPFASYHGGVKAERLLSLRRTALDELVLDELIYQEAVAEGKRAPAGAVEAELDAVRTRFDSDTQFAAALNENGLTERAFRERLARTVLVRDARAAHARQVITETDIADYYRANAARFQRPERVHLLQILVRVDPASPASAAPAERKARRILARLRNGEPFGAIARVLSEDEYRVKDGDMGWVHRGRFEREFEAAVFAASPGKFDVARSLYGFEVFEVLERQPPTQLSLDEARPIIAERLERQRRDSALGAWRARLLAAARVEIRDPALRSARPAVFATGSLAAGGVLAPVSR